MADIISEVILREGGAKETNDPDDAGGRTKYGISEKANPDLWADGPPTAERSRQRYEERYVKPFDKISYEPLRKQLIDFGVNAGPDRAIRFLQTLVQVEKDGLLGPGTLAALAKRDAKNINNLLVSMRKTFYYKLVEAKPSNRKYLKGWLNRADSFLVT